MFIEKFKSKLKKKIICWTKNSPSAYGVVAIKKKPANSILFYLLHTLEVQHLQRSKF